MQCYKRISVNAMLWMQCHVMYTMSSSMIMLSIAIAAGRNLAIFLYFYFYKINHNNKLAQIIFHISSRFWIPVLLSTKVTICIVSTWLGYLNEKTSRTNMSVRVDVDVGFRQLFFFPRNLLMLLWWCGNFLIVKPLQVRQLYFTLPWIVAICME